MSDTVTTQKKLVRQQLRELIAKMSPADRERGSIAACALIRDQPLWNDALSVFFYSPLPGELDITPLVSHALDAGKVVLFPKFDLQTQCYLPYRVLHSDELIVAKYGIKEPGERCNPYSLKQLDLTLVPALGFDLFGRRLGRGRGFYDRLLVEVSGAKCGVAFDEQIVNEVPIESHDIPVSCLLTPTRWIVIGGAKFE